MIKYAFIYAEIKGTLNPRGHHPKVRRQWTSNHILNLNHGYMMESFHAISRFEGLSGSI